MVQWHVWIDRLEPTDPPTGCHEVVGTQGVRLELTQPAGPDAINAFLAHDGSAVVERNDRLGEHFRFELAGRPTSSTTIRADRRNNLH